MSSQKHTIDEQERPELERSLAFFEIASVMTSCLIAEWLAFSIGRGSNLVLAVPIVLAFGLIFLSHRLRGETPREIGLRLDNFTKAVRLLALPMLLAALGLIVFGYLSGTLNFGRWRGGQSVLGLPALGLLWGLMQQYVLQAFINRRAQMVVGKGLPSVFFVALMFAVLHLPNPLLTAATFAGGVLWAAVYQRAPNIFALALSHGLMTWVLVSTVSPSALNNLRVGFKYFG